MLVKDNRLHSPWIERLKGSGNISELDRGLLAMTVEEIIVLDSEHIKVHFKYRDEFEIVLCRYWRQPCLQMASGKICPLRRVNK